jgi:hypothetical protein|tara:strand:- start:1989 stop:2414 length:426 start_codon:yes stop_codon:yes gene_type:complete
MENNKKKPCGCGTKKTDVKMSVPEGMEFNTSYSIPLEHTVNYWDTDRNGLVTAIKSKFSNRLDRAAKQITDLLKSKNKAYGNTALNPTNVFSKLNASEAICARIDDKLARIKNRGINDETEDTVDDLIGYLFLLKMSKDEK